MSSALTFELKLNALYILSGQDLMIPGVNLDAKR